MQLRKGVFERYSLVYATCAHRCMAVLHPLRVNLTNFAAANQPSVIEHADFPGLLMRMSHLMRAQANPSAAYIARRSPLRYTSTPMTIVTRIGRVSNDSRPISPLVLLVLRLCYVSPKCPKQVQSLFEVFVSVVSRWTLLDPLCLLAFNTAEQRRRRYRAAREHRTTWCAQQTKGFHTMGVRRTDM
jgi:hypothetical protein